MKYIICDKVSKNIVNQIRQKVDKIINNNHGMAMVTVLILIFVFLLIGTALAIVSMASFKQAIMLKGTNQAFYINDGVIEECLNEMNEMTYDAERYANYVITSAYKFPNDADGKPKDIFTALDDGDLDDTFLASDQWKEFVYKIDEDLKYGDLSDDDAALYLERALRCEFLKRYYQYLLYGPIDKDDFDTAAMDSDIDLKLEYVLVEEKNNKWEFVASKKNNEKEFFEKCLRFTAKASPALNDTYTGTLEDVDIDKLVQSKSGYSDTDAVTIKTSFDTVENLNTALKNANKKMKIKKDNENIYGLDVSITTDGKFSRFEKAINLNVRFIEPEYSYVIRTQDKGSPYPKHNDIRNYGLIAGGFILDCGSDLEDSADEKEATVIFGDVYAYGVFGEERDDVQTSAGIVLGLKSEYLKNGAFLHNVLPDFIVDKNTDTCRSWSTDGNVMTRSAFLMNERSRISVSYSDIDLTNPDFRPTGREIGNLGAGSIKFLLNNVPGVDDKHEYGAIYASNIYSLENIEIRGDSSGYIHAKKKNYDPDGGNLHMILHTAGSNGEHTGSIIIDEKSADTTSYFNADNIFIGGVAFSKIHKSFESADGTNKDVNYMTGESVNIENRYMDFYKPGTGNNGSLGYNAERYGTAVDPATGEMNGPILIDDLNEDGVDNVGLKTNLFMDNARTGSGTASDPYTSDNVNIDHKTKLQINSIDNKDPSTLKNNYALGAVLGNRKVLNPNYMMTYDKYKALIEEDVLATYSTAQDIDRQMNLLKTRNILEDKDEVYEFVDNTGTEVKKLNKLSDNAFSAHREESRLTQLIDFSDANNLVSINTRDNEACVINNNKNVPVFLNPADEDMASINALYPNDDDKIIIPWVNKAVILSLGDVYVHSSKAKDLNIKGMIASEKNIILYGDGYKSFDVRFPEWKGQTGGEHIVRLMGKFEQLYRALYGRQGRRVINLMGGRRSDLSSSGIVLPDEEQKKKEMAKIQKNFNIQAIINSSADINANEIYSTTQGQVPIILTVPAPERIKDQTLANPPSFDGMQRTKKVKGYRIISWKEVSP